MPLLPLIRIFNDLQSDLASDEDGEARLQIRVCLLIQTHEPPGSAHLLAVSAG